MQGNFIVSPPFPSGKKWHEQIVAQACDSPKRFPFCAKSVMKMKAEAAQHYFFFPLP